MADVATPELLSSLKALYPEQQNPVQNPWYYVAAVAFSASNLPEAVPIVFQYALEDLKSQGGTEADALLLVRKTREALFKSGLLSGYPKAINALAALLAVTPEHLRDKEPIRDVTLSTEELTEIGQQHFYQTYGETAATTQRFLKEIYPDFEFFCTAFAYGYAYGFSTILSPVEFSFTLVAALIASDTPRQIDWHLLGAKRNGASTAEVKAIRHISIETARAAGIVWKNEIPDIQ